MKSVLFPHYISRHCRLGNPNESLHYQPAFASSIHRSQLVNHRLLNLTQTLGVFFNQLSSRTERNRFRLIGLIKDAQRKKISSCNAVLGDIRSVL